MDELDVRLAKAAEAIAIRNREYEESQTLKQLEFITTELERHSGHGPYRVRTNFVITSVLSVLANHFFIEEAAYEDGDYYVLMPLSKGRVSPKPK